MPFAPALDSLQNRANFLRFIEPTRVSTINLSLYFVNRTESRTEENVLS
jgi:hypothetical protein